MIAVAQTFSDRDAFSLGVSNSRIKCGFELECASEYDIRGFQRKLLEGGFEFTNWNENRSGNLRAYEGYGHQHPELWNVERDGSVPTTGRYRHQIEFKSPPLPVKETLEWIDKLFPYIAQFSVAAGKTAGFHTSYSIEGVNLQRRTNFLKLLLLLSEEHMAATLDRGGNSYAEQLHGVVAARLKEEYAACQNERDRGRFFRDLIDNRTDWREFYPTLVKYLSINLTKLDAHNYVEFRLLGGKDYIEKPEQIKRMIARFAYALQVASDPRALRREYSSMLYSILSEVDESEITLRMSDIRWRIDANGGKIILCNKTEPDTIYMTLMFRSDAGKKIVYDYQWGTANLSRSDKEVIRRRVIHLISKPALCSDLELPVVYTNDILGEFTYQKIIDIASSNPGTYRWALRALAVIGVEPPSALVADMMRSHDAGVLRELMRLLIAEGDRNALYRAAVTKVLNDPALYGCFVNTHGEIIDRDSYWERTGLIETDKYKAFERELLDRFEHSDDLGLEDLGATDVEDVHFEPTLATKRRRSRRSPDGAEEA